MKSMYLLTLFVLVFSCGGDSSTAPSGPSYHSNEETFLNELTSLNSLETDSLEGRITLDDPEVTGENYDRIVALDLSGLNITELPSSIGGLGYIKELNLSGNQLSNLPEELCTVHSMGGVNININNNLLCDPTGITLCILDEIKVDFDKQGCTKVKEDQEMDFLLQFIKENSLDSLSATIFNNITWEWKDSALTDDDKQIERITEIKWVNLGITSLPGTIQNLGYLRSIELEENKLTILPAEIKWLTNLEILQAHDNQLVSLPAFIGNLTNLKYFDVQNNQLIGLPESLKNLSNLQLFNVGDNQITSLSDSLCTLTTVTSLNLECNDLDTSTGEVADCFKDFLGSQLNDPNCGD